MITSACIVVIYLTGDQVLIWKSVKGVIFVVAFKMSFISCFFSRYFVSESDFWPLVSLFSTYNWTFTVCNRRSIITVALWSPAGASIKFMLLSLQNISNSPDINACAWLQLRFLWMLWNVIYFSKKICCCICVTVMVRFAWGYLEYLFIDASIYDSFECSSWLGIWKSSWTSSFGSSSVVNCGVRFFGITGFGILPIRMRGVHFSVAAWNQYQIC